jgi:hypothetical protein
VAEPAGAEAFDGVPAEVIAAADGIIDAFGRHDTAAYFDGFASEASFIFYTTADRLDSRAAYEALWANWEAEAGFRVHGCTSTNRRVQVYGDTGIFLHDVETRLEMDGDTTTVLERETIVFERRGDRWLGVHEHLSPRP